MIDLHCHLLPGVDDGPDTLDEALGLCRQAVADGITHCVVTPHVHPGRYANDAQSIALATEVLKAALRREAIPLKLGCSGEVRISPEILPMMKAGQVPFHGQWQGRKVMLLEFPHSHLPPGSDKLIAWLMARDIVPLVAHPERNKDIMRDPARLQELRHLGCLFQVTAGALAGRFGEVAEARAREIVAAGWATVLASDAHNAVARPPVLSEGLAVAADLIGEAEAHKLVWDNPWQIAGSQFGVAA